MATLSRWQASILDKAGNVMAGTSIEVRQEIVSGQPLATLYSDRAGSVTISNPFVSDANGFAFFHAAGGVYRIRAYVGPSATPSFEQVWDYVPLGLLQERDFLLMSDLANGLTGFGPIVLKNSAKIVTPDIGVATGDSLVLGKGTDIWASTGYSNRMVVTSIGTNVTVNSPSGGTNASQGYTLVDRSAAVVNGQTVNSIGVYMTTAQALTVKILKRNSAGNYDVVASQAMTHTGTGWEDATLSSSYAVPGAGSYYIGVYVGTGGALPDSGAIVTRAYVNANVTGTGQTLTEDTGFYAFATRYSYGLGGELIGICQATAGMYMAWSNNATPASASGVLATASFANPITIDASVLTLQGLSGGPLKIGTNTVALGGNLSTAGALTLSGAFAATFTITNPTAVTFPTSGTLATRAGAETLTNKAIDASANTLSNLTTAMFAANVVDNDTTLSANSSTRLPTQAAVKAYADQIIASADAMVFKGVIDCSANPNYPAADRGWTYKVSVAGRIGGASGTVVEVGDTLMCITDGTASGNQATVGAQWNIVQANLVGAVTGPASSTSGNIATFNGTGGTVIQDGGKALPSGTIVGTSDTQALTGKTLNGLTVTTTTGTLTIANGKTLTANNSLTLAGTDGKSLTLTNGLTVSGNDGTVSFGAASKTLTVNNSLTLAGTDGTTQTFPATSGTVVTSVSTNVVTNAMAAQMTAATLKGNVTASLANAADFTIQGLTNLASPSATLDYIPIYDHVSGTIKSVTPGAIAASGVAGVGSLNTKTGSLTLSIVTKVFTASGTYTPTSGMFFCKIRGVGSAGGGGGAAGAAGSTYCGGGGQSGGYVELLASAATIGASQPVTIGAAGNGGAAGANNGGNGADCSVGALLVAKGGNGGLYGSVSQTGNGGYSSATGTGDLKTAGMPGGAGAYSSGAPSSGLSSNGFGGSSVFGGGAVQPGMVNGVATAGNNGGNYGGGGSGAVAANVTANAAGGNGATGVIIIDEYVLA